MLLHVVLITQFYVRALKLNARSASYQLKSEDLEVLSASTSRLLPRDFYSLSQGLTNGHLILYCKSGSSTEIPRSYRGTLIMDARPRTSRFIHELVMPYRQERRQEAPSEQTSMGTIIT
ncbi:hypothetical protein NW761_011453 [Fusarium oxysporum]|nr:hypothetical protein NW758_010613 [Fusarium oxysporum]KAJ4065625.1 hypothetical protein NW763_002645 [Fusarium oxysporum]KAJ4066743.1 hypothetical protein NW753_001829 [Fusarium oxysporum]KAJ4079205.1 hypothetical protein NW761_011453 [Fusarium oxysporum]KAJ4091623.1 hypothetical protein NW756_005828 [Fusarium oxysporum]